MTKAKATTRAEIRQRRKAGTISKLKKREANGEDVSNHRGYLRLGQATTQLMLHPEQLEEWDDEELRRGQRRDKNGRFQGRAPAVVPKSMHDELVRRTLKEAQELIRTSLVPALTLLNEVIADNKAEDRDRIKAAEMLIDRMLGKAPEKIALTHDAPKWLVALTESIVSLDDDDEPIDVDSWEDEADNN